MRPDSNAPHRLDEIEKATERVLDAVRGLPPSDSGLVLLMALAVLTKLSETEPRGRTASHLVKFVGSGRAA